jgi:hypothetical protein
MTIETANPIPDTTSEILDRIQAVRELSRRNQAEAAKLNLELGRLFIQLKKRAAGTWLAKLKKLGYDRRVASRLMRAAEKMTAPDGTVPARLLKRLPGDRLKLEALAALQLPQIERLVTEHDVRELDRAEVVALVKGAQGVTPESAKEALTPAEAVINGWAQAIDTLLQKLDKIQDAEEREKLVRLLDDSLQDLSDSLHGVEEQPEEDEESTEDEDGGEPAAEPEVEPPAAQEEPAEPARAEKPAQGRGVSRQRTKPLSS